MMAAQGAEIRSLRAQVHQLQQGSSQEPKTQPKTKSKAGKKPETRELKEKGEGESPATPR